MSKLKAIWEKFSDTTKKHFKEKVMPRGRYTQYLPKYSELYGVTLEEMKDIAVYIRDGAFEEKQINKEEEIIHVDNDMLHSKSYWYDENRDVYIVHLITKNRPFIIKGEMWRSIVDSYSNWDGAPLTVNEISRQFSLSRKTTVQLLRVMGMTHDSAPFTDETIAKETEQSLVEDVIRKKEERVLLKIQQIEWNKITKDANKYRVHANFAKSIINMFSTLSIPKNQHAKKPKNLASKKCLIVSPTDFHWGKYGPQYTNDGYNREIAKERLFSITSELIERVNNRGDGFPEQIVLAIGGDGLHIDNQNRSTTRGTPQDCDGTPSEIASSYVRLCVEYINLLSSYANVRVFVIQGNHDFYTSTILREAIKGWFNSDKRVSVFDSLSPRQTFLYGKSLITFMHGDTGSVKDYPTIIASENTKLFGKSKWRFIFTGHLHTERELPQWGDTTVYRMPSLAGTDEWHFTKGYKSRKALIGYIVDKDKGVISQEIVPVEKDI